MYFTSSHFRIPVVRLGKYFYYSSGKYLLAKVNYRAQENTSETILNCKG